MRFAGGVYARHFDFPAILMSVCRRQDHNLYEVFFTIYISKSHLNNGRSGKGWR